MKIAFKINGEFENLSPMHISTEKTYQFRGSILNQSDIYPLGQNIRGAFGYLFMDMKSKIVEMFNNGHPRIYFKDALIKHHDGIFLPILRIDKGIKEVIYECNTCKFKDNSPASREPMSGISLSSEKTVKYMFLTDVVSSRNKYRFEAVFNLKAKNNEEEKIVEEYFAEFMAALKFVEDYGLYVGKRISKGLGKIILKNLQVRPVTLEDIKKRGEAIEKILLKDGKITIHLLSDTIGRFPLEEEVIRDSKNAAKFFDPKFTQYKDPKILHTGKPIVLTAQKKFMDMKDQKPRFGNENIISRGAKISYQISDTSPEFFSALAMAEQLRGLGDRTTFGKGEFIIS